MRVCVEGISLRRVCNKQLYFELFTLACAAWIVTCLFVNLTLVVMLARFLPCADVHVQVQHVEGAHKELTKYFNSISSNRNLMLKILGTLLAFLVFFLVVIA
eukprot:m.23165 g.23165  ORF g.23165 m.23165 type:complete len:102 (-) comp4060_c0_seq1:59-364(-)